MIQFWPGNTGKPDILIQFWTWKYWKISHFGSVLNLEILEHQSFWFSFEPGNTGAPVILIQFWTWKYLKAPCCLGHLRKNPFGEHVPGKNTNIQYIIEGWLFDMISKKTRAKQWLNLAAVSRRDLSYETDPGLKTQTVKVTFWVSRWRRRRRRRRADNFLIWQEP